MTPMSEERIVDCEQLARDFRHAGKPISANAIGDLLAEVHRLRDLPPDVEAAMRDYASEQDADGIEELAFIIADHFTTLFQKGA